MALVNVLKNKLKRNREKLKDIESIINDNSASSVQKQDYIKIKANVEMLEDVIDLAEGMIESKE